jgi:hypothetical protein
MNEGFDDPAVARQRRRVGLWALGAKVLLLAVLVGAWWWWEQGGWRGTDSPAPHAANTGASAAASGLSAASSALAQAVDGAMAGRPASASWASTMWPAPAASAGKVVLGPIELCGVGTLRSEPEAPHLFEHALAAAWPRLLANMERSPAERSRAAALLVRYKLQIGEALRFNGSLPVEPRAALVALAQASPDPALLRWAWSQCQFQDAPASCSGLSAEGAVAQAPDDLANWLLLVQTDPTQTVRALKGAAAATRFSPTPSLVPWVSAAVPSDLPAYLRHMLLLEAHGMQVVLDGTSSGLTTLFRYCRNKGADPAACSTLAETLEQQAPDLIALMFARLIGQAQGWPAQRVAAVRARSDALTHDLLRLGWFRGEPEQWLSCASIERGEVALREFATYGELGAIRRWQAADSAAAAASR